MIRIAVIADPHVHDCNWKPAGSGLPGAIRSFGETVKSTRVFNESVPAFRAALSHAVETGAKIVLLVGDLTDDGQAPNITAALALIAEFRDRHELRVLAVPGNHDLFALRGRPQIKGFVTHEGSVLHVDSATCPEAATLGAEPALRMMQSLGYQPERSDLHWETPFGTDPDWAARHYHAVSPDGARSVRLLDASYLIEPVAGLWVLALDANTFAPRDGVDDPADPAGYVDPTGVGWSAVLDHRSYLLDWMTDVAARARAAGKHLVAFSHYPLLDVLAGTGADDLRVFGQTGLGRRTPPRRVADAFAATGIAVHFSGHLHVNDTAVHRTSENSFFNIAVPSPVGFAPALKIADLTAERIEISTPVLAKVPGHDLAFAAYRAEARHLGQPEAPAMSASDHAAFLDLHLEELVHRRYLARDWPGDMVDLIRDGRVKGLAAILKIDADCPNLALTVLVEDWYRLRLAGGLGQAHIPGARLACYNRLCAALPELQGDSLAARLTAVLRMLQSYLNRMPNTRFTLDLTTMTVSAR